MTLAFVLASGATFVISEMERLRDLDNGMTTENVVTFHLGQPMAQGIESQYYDVAWRVGQIPGVQAAGFIQVLPLQNWGWSAVRPTSSCKGLLRAVRRRSRLSFVM